MSMTSVIKNSGRALVLAVALGGAAITATPAQAGSPDVSFSFSVGTGYRHHYDRYPDGYDECLTNREVRRELRDRGYYDIRLINRGGGTIKFLAARNGRDFRLTVDSCTGQILDRVRLGRY